MYSFVMKNKLIRIRKSGEYSRLLQKHKKTWTVPTPEPSSQQLPDSNSRVSFSDPVQDLPTLDELPDVAYIDQASGGISPTNYNTEVELYIYYFQQP